MLKIKKLIRSELKTLAPKIPLLYVLYKYYMKFRTPEAIFTDIYERKGWNGKDSVSGPGSDISQTRILIEELPNLFNDFGICKVLDIPCGDFYWMNKVNLNGIDYIGADIVKTLIEGNRKQYSDFGFQFINLNLINDNLPKVDLVLCRDCLVHFSFSDIFLSFANICSSESKFILTTTFPNTKENKDILTGQWRPLNLEIAPFYLPQPLRIINENCTEDTSYEDKSLGLWKVEDIQKCRNKKAKQFEVV